VGHVPKRKYAQRGIKVLAADAVERGLVDVKAVVDIGG